MASRAGPSSGSRRRPNVDRDDEDVSTVAVRTPEVFLNMPHQNPTWVDIAFVEQCGFMGGARELLSAGGWPGLLTLCHEADVEDTSEFLGTFEYSSCRTFITFSHRGVRRRVSLARIREVFGWPQEGRFFYVGSGNERVVWQQLTGHPGYVSGTTSARYIREPLLFFLHHMISRTLFARKDGSDKPNRKEVGVLHLLSQGEAIDWAHYFCLHLNSLRVTGTVCIGGMVTYLLRQLFPGPNPPDHAILVATTMGFDRFRYGKNVRLSSTGEVRWIYHKDPSRRPDVTPPRTRGRPRRQASVESQSAASEPSHQQQQYEPTQQQIDDMFHAARTFYISVIGGVAERLPAPPGWRPGMAIPPEYLQPFPPPEGH